MRKIVTLITLFLLMLITAVSAQERAILMPIQVNGAPFSFDDSDDMFGESYRWFREGDIDQAADVLRKTITSAGVTLDPAAHYVVVAHYTDSFAPIGMIHGEESDFFNTRLFGLGEDNLYYIFVSRTPDAPSFLSVMATAKDSPFNENLLGFLGLLGIFNSTQSTVQSLGGAATTYVDVRRFTIPEVFRKFSDISFLVKKELSDERDLAAAIFDNTSKERWSFGLALGMTASMTWTSSSAATAPSSCSPSPARTSPPSEWSTTTSRRWTPSARTSATLSTCSADCASAGTSNRW